MFRSRSLVNRYNFGLHFAETVSFSTKDVCIEEGKYVRILRFGIELQGHKRRKSFGCTHSNPGKETDVDSFDEATSASTGALELLMH